MLDYTAGCGAADPAIVIKTNGIILKLGHASDRENGFGVTQVNSRQADAIIAAARHRGAKGRFHLAGCAGRGSICTVAVMPAARTTPSGTWSMWMRTGMRCAKRTQVKIGLTAASPCWSGWAFATLMPRAMLPTCPRTIWL